jgi:hypothetical protein
VRLAPRWQYSKRAPRLQYSNLAPRLNTATLHHGYNTATLLLSTHVPEICTPVTSEYVMKTADWRQQRTHTKLRYQSQWPIKHHYNMKHAHEWQVTYSNINAPQFLPVHLPPTEGFAYPHTNPDIKAYSIFNYLAIYLSVCLSVYLSIYLSIHPSITYLSIYPSIHHLSIYLSIAYLSKYPQINPPIYKSTYKTVGLDGSAGIASRYTLDRGG